MADNSQVTTLVVAVSILAVAVAFAGGGAILALRGGRVVVGALAVVLGLAIGVGALLFTLSPMVARRYDPDREEGGGGDEA
jgi:hypothetical protein